MKQNIPAAGNEPPNYSTPLYFFRRHADIGGIVSAKTEQGGLAIAECSRTVAALRQLFHVEGRSVINISQTLLNNVLLPDGLILLSKR